MKHLFKKGLSLLLAVLMVTSALPMSTLAAAVTDGRTAGDGVYSTREDADPPEAELPDETGEGLTDDRADRTEAPADITDGEEDLRVELPADRSPVDEEPADAAAADAEDDLRVELPADMDLTAEPTDNAAADGEDDLRTEIPQGEDQNGDRPEKPDIGEEPDVPAEPLWANQSVTATINPDGSWVAVVKTNAAGNTVSGDWGLALIPNAKRGTSTGLPSSFAADQNDGTVSTYTKLAEDIGGATGLRNNEFVVVGGSGMYTDADGKFTVSSTTQGVNMPDVDTLGDLGLTVPMDVVVIFFAKGADGGYHVVTTTATYGEVESATGIPSLVYTLNKADGSLTLNSATLAGKPWTAPDPSGSWSVTTLTVPVYNRTGDGVTVNTGTISMPSGVTGTGLTNETIDNNDQVNISFDVPSSVTSGIITIPVSGETVNGGDLVSATITVRIINSGYTANEIKWEVTEGYSESDAEAKAIVINKPASATTVKALVNPTNGSEEITATAIDSHLALDNTGVTKTTRAGNTYATAYTFETHSYSTGGSRPQLHEILATELKLQLLIGLETDDHKTPKTYTFMVTLMQLAPVTASTTTITVQAAAQYQTINVPVTVVVNPPQEVVEDTTVVFNPKDGSANTNQTGAPGGTATPPDGYTVDTTIKTISGKDYLFKGWSTSEVSVGTATSTTTSFTFPNSGTATYYGVWEALYTVNYADAAAATYPQLGTDLPSDTNKYKQGDEVTVSSAVTVGTEGRNATTGLYYTFTGWNDGTNDRAPGAKFNMGTANVTLTAQWSPVMQKVTFVYNDGTTANKEETDAVQKGGSYSISDADPTWAGHTFKGWTVTGGTASDSPLKTGGSVNSVTGDVTLSAQWDTLTYSVTFDPNGGTWSAGSGSKNTTGEYADKVKAPTETVSKTGYNFGGWFETDNAGALTTTQLDTSSHTYGAKDGMTYKAKWDAKDVTVKYVAGHGTNPADDTVKFGTTGHNLKAATAIGGGTWDSGVLTVTESGATHKYRFDGWARTGTTAVAQIDIDEEGPITVTAMWTEIFTITYANPTNTTPGSITGKTVDELSGATHAVLSTGGKAPTPTTSTGYTFVGWSTTDNSTAGTATYTASGTTSFKVTGNVTLYPVWSLNKHTLKYDMQGHGTSSKPADSSQNYDATVTLSTTPAVNSKVTESNIHWVFGGWSETVGGTAVASVTMPDADKTVYALWAKDSHSVTYNANSGTLDAAHTAATVTCGDPYSIPSELPTRTGFTFGGWKDGDGNSYSAGGSIASVTKDTVLTAQWTQGQSSIVYNWQDPTNKTTTHTGNTSATDGNVPGTSSSDKPTYTGYTWDGKWYAEPGCTTQVTTFTYPAAVSGTVNYYAKWTVNPHTVTYNRNNGPADTVLPDPNPVNTTYSATVTVGSASTPTAGWHFKGWSRSSGNQEVTENTGDTITMADADITLYAQWEIDVTFQVNGGTWSDNTNTDIVKTGKPGADGLSAPTGMTKAGHDPNGWSPALPTGGKFPTAPATYVAQWTVKQYTVTFVWNTTANSHTADQQYAQTSGNYGLAITTPTNDPGMTGYTFGGWYKEAACTNKLGTSDTYPDHNNMKVYAKWTANEYAVTYAVGKFTDGQIKSGESPQTVTYDDTTCVVKAGTIVEAQTGKSMTGWNFVKWTDETGKKDWAVGAALSKITAAMTLTAQWTVDVDFQANLPETSSTVTAPGVRTAPAGQAVTSFPGKLADLDHYTFDSWNTKADGTGTTVTASTIFNAPAEVYAKWTPKKYTVSFVDNSGDSSNPADEANKDYNSTITLPASNGDKTGYTFDGWYRESALTNKEGGVGDNYTVTATTTLYGKWNPVDVTIVYQTDVGTAPGSDTKKYDATDYTAKNKNTIKNTAGAGWNASETIFTDDSGNRWQFNGWDILKADGSVLKQVNSAAAINPVNTTNGVVKKADGTYTLTLKANWTQLYSVTYNANSHGTVDTSKNVVDHVAWTYDVLDGSEVITTGGTWAGSYFTDTAGRHWKFNGWLSSADSKTYNKGNNFAVSQDITLTAQWDEYYLVTLAPPVLTDTSTALGVHATVTFGTSGLDSSYTNKSVWVKKDDGMAIANLTLKKDTDDYIFAKWTQTSTTAGAFTTATGGTSAADTFTPKSDTTLTPNYWRKPTLTTINSYHQNFATDAAVATAKWGSATNKKPTNTLPAYTWTKNNATLASSDELQIELTSGTWTTLNVATAAGTGVDVVKSTDASGNVTYTFQRDYLMTLAVPMGDTSKSFNIRVQSDTPDTTTTNHDDTTRTAVLEIAVNPDPLEQVDIQAKTAAGDLTVTASVESASGRDQVEYWTHLPITIDKDNKLTYAWYYGPSAPKQKDYSTALANNNATNTSNATANLPADKTAITGVTGPTVDVKDPKYKGMYIYAVVTASNTGYGAVITNSIPVDYDATVTVKKDTNTVSADTGYTVYLLEKKDGNADGYATMPATKKITSWNSTKNYFETTNSALTGGVTYDVYVNKVEGDTTYYVKTGQTVSPTSQSATVNFYSVNEVKTDLKHAEDKDGNKVGEDFSGTASAPTTAFTTTGDGANTITVNSTDGVFAGSTVTAAASKAWGQDYWWNWQSNTTGDAFTSYGAEHKTSGNTGKEYTISAKTYIGGQMEQKTYTVKGNVWALGNNTNAGVKDPLLTANGHSFSGTWDSNGKHKGVVTFTVPKSGVAGELNSENYVISATPYTGTETGLGTVSTTTLVKYAEYIDVNAGSTNDAAVNGKAALSNDTIAQITATNNGAFTIVVTASNWTLQVQDDDATKKVDQSATHTTAVKAANNVTKVDNANTTTTWTKTFANYASAQKVYNVTVSNPGNTDLKVSLVVKKTVGSTTTTVYDGSATVTSDSANSVAFTDLTKDANSFDLAAKTDTATDSKTFVVTLPDDLDNNDDVTYSFEFTSKDKNDNTIYGPSITYNLKLVIDPIPVKSVGIKANAGGTFSADNLVFDATSAPLDAGSTPTLTTTNDLTYQWYVGTQPQLDATTGAITNASSLTAATGSGNATATYTPATADGGKTLWLVVSGKNNASKAAKASVAAPYSAKVTIMEDTTATTSYGDYKVYLVPTDVTTQPTDWTAAGIVEATHETTDAQGVFTTGADLVAGTKYNVWTNVVKGTTSAVYQNNGALGNTTDGVASKTVTYYSVTVNETTYNNTYTGLTGTAFFGTGTDGTTATTSATGNTGITATAAAGATPVASGGWVVSGTEVTFTHDAWNKDYTLAWTGATKQGTDGPTTTGSTAKTTVSANKTVDAELTLNLYKVTVYVVGSEGGSVNEIKLDNQGAGPSFTTLTGYTGYLTGVATAQNSGVSVGTTAVFSVPDGTYTVSAAKAAGSNIEGYLQPHTTPIPDMSTHKNPVDVMVSAAATTNTADVVVQVAGQVMSVTDDAETEVGDVALNTVTGSGNNSAAKDSEGVSDGAYTRTITLPYGYTADSFTITVKNSSLQDTDIIHNVAMAKTSTQLGPNNEITITDAANTSPIVLDGSQDMAKDATTTVSVGIAAGLGKGTYTSQLDFTFETEGTGVTGNATATVTYNLVIKVEPAEFTEVTVKAADGTSDISTMVPYGVGLEANTFKTEDVNLFGVTGTNAIAENTDYTYAWYVSDLNKSATESWTNNGGVAVANASPVKDASGNNVVGSSLSADIIKLYQGKKLYLVITAAKDKNVIEADISDPVTTGFQPVVKVSVDGTTIATEAEPTGYVAKLVGPDNTEYATVWDKTLKGYVPANGGGDPIYLPSGNYTVKVGAYSGATTATVTLPAADNTLSLTKTTVTAPYFTVNAVDTKAFAYRSDVGEDFGGDDKLTGPAVSFTLGGTALASGTPVLSGQSVKANTATWAQDYKLTWYTRMDGAATVPTRDTAYTDTGATMTKQTTPGKVDSTSASGTGYTVTSVTNKLYVGGRLDQNTYTINVTISGTGSVASVATTQNADSTVAFTGTNDDKNGNSLFDQGDTMKFTVVASDYDIAATQGPSTNIVSVKWEEENAVTGNKLTKKNVAKNPAKDTYSVVINIESAKLDLTVSDDKATPNKASAGIGEAKGVTNSEVRYFSGIPANDKLDLSLTNSGNKPLDTTMTVYHFDKVGSIPAYADATKWGTSATGYLASAPTTAGDLADSIFKNADGRQVITVTAVMADGTTVAARAGSDASNPAVPAGTITIGPGAFNKDDGVYVFRFVGDDKDADTDNPVVYYVLDLTIQPLPITGVTTDTPTTAPGAGDKVQLKGATDGTTGGFNNVMVDPDGAGTAASVAADSVADPALVDGTDVKYQWVRTTTSMTSTAVKDLLKVDDTSGVISSTDTSKVKLLDNDNGANTKQYTVQDTDIDGYLYLVAYAPGASVNASSLAVSAAIKTKRTVGVQVSLDGTIQPISGTADPGYVIYLVEDGKTFDATNAATGDDGTWATTWDGAKQWYQAPVDVDNITYHVYAPSFKGGANYVDTGLTVGKNVTTTPVVPYFSVAHTTNMTVTNTNDGFKAYLPSSNATNKVANQVQSALTVAVSDNRNVTTYDRGDVLSAASVPVLKDMNVKVTVDATAASNNADTTGNVKKSWKDTANLHTMTSTGWEPGTATSATTTEKTGIAYPTDDGEGNFLVQSGNIAVTEKKSFSATLKQKLFDVTFVVKDNTPEGSNNSGITPSIAGATLKTDTAKETATEAAGFTATATSIGRGEDGATVRFSNIPVGALWITATAGERTNVDGYTWNATGDTLNDPKDPGKIVNTDTTDATNKHAGNTIQIQYSSNAIRWYDNFNTSDGSLLKEEDGTTDKFVQSGGFQKVDTVQTGPFLALKEGYSTDTSAVLTYKVRVKNTGANDLENFRISQNGATVDDLIADLTKVKVYDADGNETSDATDVTAMGFTLLRDEMVEFEVTIPSGDDEKEPSSINYTSTFQVWSTNEGAVAGGNYNPAYRVKPVVAFDAGNAKVIYGNNKFEDTPVDIASAWDTDVYNPDFAFSVLTEAETKTYLSATTLADHIYYAGEGSNKLPAWLVLDTDSGVVTFDSNLYATDVNVRVKDATSFDNYTDDEVDNEVVFYIKAVDQDTLAEYYTSYTVNVEPGQLNIQDPSFTYTDDEAVGGLSVDKSKFTYTSVINQATAPLDVIPASAITGDNNTALGNNTPKDSTVIVDGDRTATWTVAPDKYVSEVSTDYAFTVTYTPKDDAEKWNYKPDTYVETITASKPKMDLLFSDVLGKAGNEPDSAELKIGRAPDDGYSPIATDDNEPYAPAAMEQNKNTYRLGEYIVYLDTEPKYEVTLTGIGDIYNVTVKSELNGFKVVGTDLSFTGNEIHDTAKTFTLELAPMSGTTNQWAGTHTAKYTVTGNSKAEGDGDSVKATYELVITVKPKIIAEAHVTGPTEPTPGGKPSTTITVTAKDPEGEDIKPGTPDKHGNTPIKPDVKWTEGGKPVDPSKNFEDGKDYTVTVTLPADPNYTFENKDPANDPDPNYTKDGKTDTNDDPAKVDEDLTVTVTPDPDGTKKNKEVKLEKTTELPKKSHLEFEDVNANNASDKVTHAVNAVRQTITVIRGNKLGKYNISLGAYDNDVTNVTVREVTKNLPTGTVWSLEPANVGSLAKDGKQTYVLDLTGVDTTKNTGAYTLKLEAEGKDPYGTKVTSTYTVTIQVVKAAAPTLMFDDVKQTVAGVVTTDPATTGPKVDDERAINTIVGGQLGKYTIYLGSYGSTSYDVSVKATPSENLAGVYTLTPDCDTMAPVTLTSCGTVANAANADKTKAQAFELDLTGMSVSKTGTYTLLLEAEGKDINGDDVTATYTLTIQVDKAPAGVLKFEDVNAANASDKVAPAPAAVRKTIEVQKGQALGKYLISLGAYGNTVNGVTVTEAEVNMPDGTAWTLDPASIATMKNVEATPAGDKTTYTLDMTGVDTAKTALGTYTLKLKAEGTDINGDPTTATYEITVQVVKAPAPTLMFEDVNADRPTDVTAPAVEAQRNISQSTNAKLGKYIISLGSYGGTTTDIKFTEALVNFANVGVYGVSPDCEALAPVTLTSVDLGGGKQAFALDLTGMDTKTSGTYTLTITAKGVDINGDPVEATYTLTVTLRAPGGGGGGGGGSCPTQVTYLLGLYGTTDDPTMEMVSGSKVKTVPNVTAVTGYKFLGWSLVGPTGNIEQDAKRALVDPKSVSITTDTVFYAVYQPVYAVPQPPIHKHYVIGYPNGNFGPADNIDRASVATIIARAVLPNFVEGADYGNPGGYSDVNGHWAASAIAYCSKYGVFNGYTDGTFKPNQPISRQELALVMARLNGVRTGGSVPFTDIDEAGEWALDGIYTAYINGWVNGYTDGTFKPVNPIRRDETVKIFNAYLHRGVNAEGLEGLTEYVHSGVASNNTEDGTTEYMTWPDVTKDQWAYYEIIEAANDHEFAVDSTQPKGYAVPEQWTKCWIDEKWRYHDDANDGGPSTVVEVQPSESGLAD